MTEVEWASSANPDAMLRFVRGKVSDRKLRLFAAASFRRLVALLPDPRHSRGLDALEQWAEGALERAERRRVITGLMVAIPFTDRTAVNFPRDDQEWIAMMLYREFCSSSIATHAIHTSAGLADRTGERRAQAQLMRCICGSPFRTTVIDRCTLSSAAVALAESIYEERAFERMPFLAETLERARFDDRELLIHCRSESTHARGCWAIDQILGKD